MHMDIYMHRHTHAVEQNLCLVFFMFGSWLHFGSWRNDACKEKVLFIQSLQCHTQDMKEASLPGRKTEAGPQSWWSPFNPMRDACFNVFDHLPQNNTSKDPQKAYSWGTYINHVFFNVLIEWNHKNPFPLCLYETLLLMCHSLALCSPVITGHNCMHSSTLSCSQITELSNTK